MSLWTQWKGNCAVAPSHSTDGLGVSPRCCLHANSSALTRRHSRWVGGWLSEADLTADKCLCARLTCQSVLTRSNTSHVFASRAVFVVVLCCCRTLKARMKKNMPSCWRRDWTFTGIHTRQMTTCGSIGSSGHGSRAILLTTTRDWLQTQEWYTMMHNQ